MTIQKLLPPALYMALCLVYALQADDFLGIGLAWNMGLALLPVFFIEAAHKCKALRGKGVLLALWLLFLPNTFYMLTDLIHVPAQMEWRQRTEAGVAVLHIEQLAPWMLVFLLGAGAVLAVGLGCYALFRFEQLLPPKRGVRWAGATLVCGLCGVGVYMGRFLRLNSWDVLHPLRLVQKVMGDINVFSVQLMLLMAGMILLLYVFYRLWMNVPEWDRQ